MTGHQQLVDLAARWLWGFKKCSLVVTELSSSSPEQPDAIGFRFGHSWLVECKTSRSDFMADADKHFRRYDGHAMGTHRYYLAPPGIIGVTELPEGWGLLEQKGKHVYIAREATFQHATDRRYEIEMMTSCFRRVMGGLPKTIRCKSYTIDGKGEPRAALYINQMAEQAQETSAGYKGEDLFT